MNYWLHSIIDGPIYFTRPDGFSRILMKDAPSPPPAPDYTGAAAAQGAANVETAKQQGLINNPNINNPYGSQQVTWDASGQPTINQTLAPAQQQLLDAQNRISNNLAGVAESGLNRVGSAMATPFDTTNIQPLQADAAARQAAQDAAYRSQTARLDPQFQTQQDQLETKLRNQGLVPGGEAYDLAMRDFNFGKNDAYSQAFNNSFNTGLAAQQADFGMQNQANNANLQQQSYLRSLPLNELNALRTGSQVQNPTFQQYNPTQIGQTPIFNAAQAQNAANQNAYNAQVGANNAFTSGLFSLGAAGLQGLGAGGLGSGASLLMLSDRRLKSNIVKIGIHPLDIGVYEYDIFGLRTIGVMADEVEKVMPDAVMTHGSGYKMVNYGKL